MQWMQSVQTVLSDLNKKSGNVAGTVAPAAIGGIVGALLTGKKGRRIAGNALLIGGGAALASVLWKKYTSRDQQQPDYGGGQFSMAPAMRQTQQSPRTVRLITAMVFAAKSDGVIDDAESAAIHRQVEQLQLGSDAEEAIQDALTQPLDPAIVAKGVESQEEALELYLLSCSVIEVDHFMEQSYLDALAKQLGIPGSVTAEVRSRVASGNPQLALTAG